MVALLLSGCTLPAVDASNPEEEDAPTAEADPAAEAELADLQDSPKLSNDVTLTLGDVSGNPVRKLRRYQPFAKYLAGQLDGVGIEAGDVKIAPDVETMVQKLKSGEVDLYFDSPFPAMEISELSGATPILRRWKKGVGAYHTVIFSLKGGAIKTAEDLKGQTVAFDDPWSTSGYMLPIAHLKELGFGVEELSSLASEPAPDAVGYFFSGDDDSSIQWVVAGRVGAAAIGSSDFDKIPLETRDRLHVVAETESVPRQLVMVGPHLSPEQVEAIAAVLVAADGSEEGKAALEKFESTTEFDALPEGTETAFSRLQKLHRLAK